MSDLSQQIANTSAVKLALAVRRMRSKAGGIHLLNAEPIAIIGMGCRFPGGAHCPESYWQLLRDGVDAITQIPPDRWDVEAFFDPDPEAPGKMYTRWGGFLPDIQQFDCRFFGIAPREAETMDPQQRLLLEVSWEALENAGQATETLVGSQSGVFVGISLSEYGQLFREAGSTDFVHAGTGNASSVASGRISYALGLQGPTLSVDTACSSGLVAVHLACLSLRAEECRLALAGGVNLILTPTGAIYFSKIGAMAPDGRCKTFAAAADGYVRSEGCGVVVLKRLSDAMADADRILGLIRGSAVNHDGRSSGLTVPNGPAQQAVMRAALANAGVEPAQVSYLEAHGTGTPLGDPIEFGALAEVFGEGRPEPLFIGSVKTNIGHTESAAGIAGLMKTVLALQHGAIPPHLHFEKPSPHVALDRIPAVIPTALTPWPADAARRIAGVSSFALSGTNAHVVLEEAPAQEELPAPQESRTWLLPISARSPDALAAMAEAYANFLARKPAIPLRDIAFSAARRRAHHDFRWAVVGRSHEELAEHLRAAAVHERVAAARKLVFVFPGQGSQWLGMGRELLADEPVFRTAIESADAAMRPHVDWSVLEMLAAEPAPSALDRTDVIQPALFAMQVSLAALWRSWGIRPHAVVGHSLGEVAAAHVAGALSLEDAARIICLRSRLLTRISGTGAMAVVELSMAQAQRALTGYEDRLAIAAVNSSRSTVLSGDPAALDDLLVTLERHEIFTRRVKVDVASHSPHVDSLGPSLLDALRPIESHPTALPFYSTVTAELAHGTSLNAAYWVRNLRQPVRFAQTIERLRTDGHSVFLEISPHPILLPAIEEQADVSVLPSLRRDEPERAVMLGSLGSLYGMGFPVEWSTLYPAGGVVSLPLYPWQRQRYWLAPAADQAPPPAGVLHLQSAIHPETHFWEKDLGAHSPSWLAHHRVQDAIVMPAAGYVDMALTAAVEAFGPGPHSLEDLAFQRPLVVPENGTIRVQLVFSAGSFQVLARQAGAWEGHATGKLRPNPAASPARVSLEEVRSRCPEQISGTEYYRTLEAVGLRYGASLQGVQQIWRRDGESLGRLRLPHGARAPWLDAAFQLLAAAVPQTGAYIDIYLPSALDIVRDWSGQSAAQGTFWGHAVLRPGGESDADSFQCDVSLLDDEGQVLLEASGLRVQRVSGARNEGVEDWLYELRWHPRELPTPHTQTTFGCWLLCASRCELTDLLKQRLESQGEICSIFAPGEHTVEECRQFLQENFSDRAPRGIVHLASLDAPPPESTTLESLEAAQASGSINVLHLVQSVAQMAWPQPPRLWLVTSGAQFPDSPGFAQAPLWGLGRVIALEHPELRCTRVDLDSITDAGLLARELLAGDLEDQISWRGGVRFVARLARYAPEEKPTALPALPGQPFRLEIATPGILDHLTLRAARRPAPGPGEVEIEVRAAGLNFNDVMKAMGVYPGLPEGPVPLGNECSGKIVAVGPGAEGFSLGDEVVAIAPYSLGAFVTAAVPLVARKPPHLSFEQAAAIPLAFLTAVYTLRRLARLVRGERVLIHAASGGVGLAAIQIAQLVGAEIFATAGSSEKRAYLESLGVPHVLDSRSLSFAEEVLARTHGRGVDVVLNSLSGDAMLRSLELVAPFGRFLEIGKRDIYENRAVGLAPFQKHLVYFSVDLARLFAERPSLCAAVFREVMEDFANRMFQPLRLEAFPMDAAIDAFRHMAQARHIGKIVISLDSPNPILLSPGEPAGVTFRGDATYLITGGLGGLGLAIARWMADRGGRHLALLTRNEPSAGALAAVASLQKTGAQVALLRADVSEKEQVASALAEIDRTMPPLAGILHAAGLLDDGVLLRQSETSFRRVMAPKIAGSWNLHTLTADRPLDFFVLFSSAASLLGSPGQGNYAAANAFLDALAHYRRARGLPALSINWGAWSQVGLAARSDPGGRMALLGMMSITPEQGVEALGRAMALNVTQVAVMRLQLYRWLQLFPHAAAAPFLNQLVGAAGSSGSRATESRVRKALAALEPGPQRRTLLESHLREELAHVLRLNPSQIDRNLPLQSFGLDSLMALELRNRLEASLGLTLSATLVWGHPTISALATHLAAKMEILLDAAITPEPSPPAHDREVEELKQLSEDEAEALLIQELSNLQSKRSR